MCELFFIILIVYSTCLLQGICPFVWTDQVLFFPQRTFFRSSFMMDGVLLRKICSPLYRIQTILEVIFTVFSTGSENSRNREIDQYEAGAVIALAAYQS
jgi:hypothetical protein